MVYGGIPRGICSARTKEREREREREREVLHRVVTDSATRERQRSIVLLNGVSSLSLSSSLFSVSRSPARSLVSEGLKRLCPGAHGQCLAR